MGLANARQDAVAVRPPRRTVDEIRRCADPATIGCKESTTSAHPLFQVVVTLVLAAILPDLGELPSAAHAVETNRLDVGTARVREMFCTGLPEVLTGSVHARDLRSDTGAACTPYGNRARTTATVADAHERAVGVTLARCARVLHRTGNRRASQSGSLLARAAARSGVGLRRRHGRVRAPVAVGNRRACACRGLSRGFWSSGCGWRRLRGPRAGAKTRDREQADEGARQGLYRRE